MIDEPINSNRKDVGKDVALASKILKLIIEDSEISMAGMAKKLNVTSRTVEREVGKLRESGRIERVVGRRFGRWEIRETCD